MDLLSPEPVAQSGASTRAWRAARRSTRLRGSSCRPSLCLHVSGGQLSWAVVTGGAASQLLAAGSVRAAPDSLAATLTALVGERGLPRLGARLAIPGSVRIVDATQPPAPIGAADIALADGRRIRAEVDASALAAGLAACAAAGIEIVSAEPEALPLARSLAAPSPGASPSGADVRPAVAAVWVAASCTVVVRSCGDEVELVGLVPAGAASAPYLVAPAVARLIGGAGFTEVVVAAGDDPEDLAARIAFATSLPVRVGDPLSRIATSEPLGPVAGAAAGAVGLAVEARGLPRVDIPVRWQPAAAHPELSMPETAAPAGEATLEAAPEPRDRRPAANRAVVLTVAVVIVVGALVGGWAAIERGTVRDRATVLTTLETQLAAIPSPTAPTRRLLVLGADRRARVDAIAAALADRIAWDRILREVSAVLPADVWLTRVEAAAVKGADDLRLRGFATDQKGVALALTRLALLPDLADVRLERSERAQHQGRQVVRFAVVAAVLESAR